MTHNYPRFPFNKYAIIRLFLTSTQPLTQACTEKQLPSKNLRSYKIPTTDVMQSFSKIEVNSGQYHSKNVCRPFIFNPTTTVRPRHSVLSTHSTMSLTDFTSRAMPYIHALYHYSIPSYKPSKSSSTLHNYIAFTTNFNFSTQKSTNYHYTTVASTVSSSTTTITQ